ncbi:MAG: gamma-glutamyl-gamma-aminobutyrate hydrolase family protein [Parvularculaceae bacterium]
MRIAILETGSPPERLAASHGDYPQMLQRLLAPHGSRLSFYTVHAASGEALPGVAEFDGLLITGSPAGVYEEHDWIAPAEALIREAAAAKRPQVGICFGHQLMAKAFGGHVEKSDRGWGIGVHAYDVRAGRSWMRPAPARISCAVSHQDQVVAAPQGAVTLASSEFCPFAALAYAQGPAVSFQMHPEFPHDYARALIDLRKERFAPGLYDEARASLAARTDSDVIARWIANFYEEPAA